MYTFSPWGDEFSSGDFSMGRQFYRGKLIRGKCALGECVRIAKQNPFYMSCFLFSVSILRMELRKVNVLHKFSPGLNCLEDISVGRGFLRGDGARFPGII